MNWGDNYYNQILRALGGFGRQPMTAYGRYVANLDRGDRDWKAADEAISDELLAALRRIQITSARTS